MKILIVSHTYWPHLNGQAVFVTNLAEGLVERGHKVTVLLPSTERPALEVRNGVSLETTPCIDLRFIHKDLNISYAPVVKIKSIFDRLQPDLVHLQDPAPVSQLARQIAKKRGIAVIATHHPGPAIWAPYLPGENLLVQKVVVPIVWSSFLSYLNKVDQVTVPSRASARMLIRKGLHKPVRPISCGVKLEQFNKSPDKTGNEDISGIHPSLPAGTLRFLYVGRLDEEKRVDVLIRAMGKVRNPDIQLILAGDGSKEKMIRRLVVELNLVDQVKFLGRIERAQVADILRDADVFVMPGDGESLSIATLEAMACGLPVIASNSMALPELVQSGKNGLLFQPGNEYDLAEKMDQMAAMPRRWKQMGNISKEMAKNHQLSLTIDGYENLYLQMRNHQTGEIRKQVPLKAPRQVPSFMLNSNLIFFMVQFAVIITILVLTLFYQNSPVIAAPGTKIDLISDDMLAGLHKLFTIIKQIDLSNNQINNGMNFVSLIKQGFG